MKAANSTPDMKKNQQNGLDLKMQSLQNNKYD